VQSAFPPGARYWLTPLSRPPSSFPPPAPPRLPSLPPMTRPGVIATCYFSLRATVTVFQIYFLGLGVADFCICSPIFFSPRFFLTPQCRTRVARFRSNFSTPFSSRFFDLLPALLGTNSGVRISGAFHASAVFPHLPFPPPRGTRTPRVRTGFRFFFPAPGALLDSFNIINFFFLYPKHIPRRELPPFVAPIDAVVGRKVFSATVFESQPHPFLMLKAAGSTLYTFFLRPPLFLWSPPESYFTEGSLGRPISILFFLVGFFFRRPGCPFAVSCRHLDRFRCFLSQSALASGSLQVVLTR